MPRYATVYDEAKSQGLLWTPYSDGALLSAIETWFDASHPGSLTISAGEVTTWVPRIGNTATVPATYNGPTIDSSVFAASRVGPRVPLFSIAGDTVLAYTSPRTNSNTLQTLAMLQSDNNNTFGLWFGHRDSVTQLIQWTLRRNATNEALAQLRGSGNNLQNFGPAFSYDSSPCVMCACLDAVNDAHFIDVNGANRVTSTYDFGAETFNSTIQVLGGYALSSSSYTANLSGTIAEVINIAGAFSQAQRDRWCHLITGYLAWKWGQEQRLVASSPFRSRPPMIGD